MLDKIQNVQSLLEKVKHLDFSRDAWLDFVTARAIGVFVDHMVAKFSDSYIAQLKQYPANFCIDNLLVDARRRVTTKILAFDASDGNLSFWYAHRLNVSGGGVNQKIAHRYKGKFLRSACKPAA